MESFCVFATAGINTDTENLLAVYIGDECVIVGHGEPDFCAVCTVRNREGAADIDTAVFILHAGQDGAVIFIPESKAGGPLFPGRLVEIEGCPVFRGVVATGQVALLTMFIKP